MNAVEYRFLEPLDVLFLRGNKLFGDPGSFGESPIPPWPSVPAGALRSRMLADARLDWNPARNKEAVPSHPELGTPDAPGPFTVTGFHLARRLDDGKVEPLFAPPADLVLSRDDAGELQVRALGATVLPSPSGRRRPEGPDEGEGRILSSAPLPLLPVLAEAERSKPVSGHWFTAAGWEKYLQGETPSAGDFIPSRQLWDFDPRVGVGLDSATRRAADGRLFSVQAVAMTKRGCRIGTNKESGKPILAAHDVGFLVAVRGANPPKDGTLRLGGDGRAAAIHVADLCMPEPTYDAICRARRCRLVLTSPGIFPDGWVPTGVTQTEGGEFCFELHGVGGKLVCAALPRAEVVSGWDLAKWQPKPAQRAAPTGSVYWLGELEATPEALLELAESGLWPDSGENGGRRAEGFNRIALAEWR